jgi:hypothetical protein
MKQIGAACQGLFSDFGINITDLEKAGWIRLQRLVARERWGSRAGDKASGNTFRELGSAG